MPFSSYPQEEFMRVAELSGILEQLQESFISARIHQIYQLSAESYEWVFRKKGETLRLYFSLVPQFSRVHLLSRTLVHPQTPTSRCMLLRRYLGGAILEGLEQLNHDRHLCFSFRTPEDSFSFYLELFHRLPNGILTDKKGRILDCFHSTQGKRILQVGEIYEFPPPPQLQETLSSEVPSVALKMEEIEEKYFTAAYEHLFQQYLQREETRLQKSLQQLRKIQEKILQQLEQSDESEHFLQWGELLKGNFALIPPGASSFETIDYYHPEMPLIPIPLSPEKTVEENVASYFKKAQKMQRSRQHLQERLEETEETLLQQEEEYEQLQNDPQSVILPLIETSATGVPTPPRKKIQTESKPYREFLSHDKLRLLVGKSSSDNDTLTLRIAKGNDLFLHVQGFPGSHVIIPTPKGKSVPLDTLLEGALLAKYFSKARSHQKSNIQYCQKKYIRKAKGAKPGQVLLQQAKTLYIENDEPRLKKVLNSVVEKEDPS